MIKADCGFKMPWRIAVNRAYDIIMKLEKRKEYGPGKN